MWRWQLLGGATLLCGLPLLNALNTDTHLGVSLWQGAALRGVAGFDLLALAMGLLLVAAARQLQPRQPGWCRAGR